MAIIFSKEPCVAAGTFTTNVAKAAPVTWDQKIVKEGKSGTGDHCEFGDC
mgnify:CR=1 FL=1